MTLSNNNFNSPDLDLKKLDNYLKNRKYDEALDYLDFLRQKIDANQPNRYLKKADIYKLISNVYNVKLDFDNSLEYFIRYLSNSEKSNDYKNYNDVKLSKEAILSDFKNLELNICKSDYKSLNYAICLDLIGVVNQNLSLNNSAKKAYKKSLKIFDQLKADNDINKANTLRHLGNLYFIKGKVDKALENLEQAAKIYEKDSSSKIRYALTLQNIGSVYLQKNNLKKL